MYTLRFCAFVITFIYWGERDFVGVVKFTGMRLFVFIRFIDCNEESILNVNLFPV